MSSELDNGDCALRRAAAEVLIGIIDKDWTEEKYKVPVTLLRALCELERDAPTPGGHDGLVLARRLAENGDKQMRVAVESDKEGAEARNWIRRRWGRLRKDFWPEKSGDNSTLKERFRETGLGVVADIHPKEASEGGSRNRNLYRLSIKPLPVDPEATRGPASSETEPTTRQVSRAQWGASTTGLTVRYNEDTKRHIRWFPTSGLCLDSPFARTVASFLMMVFVAGTLILSSALIGASSAASTSEILKSLLSVSIVTTLMWLLLRRWIHLLSDNVAIAPMPWNGTARGNNILVIRRTPGGQAPPTLHLVRYVADCPVCGGELGRSAIGLESGRTEFFGRRLVGRCRNAPNAHVWSFDHITRYGQFLR